MNPALTAEVLLAHDAFVRNLAGSLLADGASADDLAQDTWLSFLRRPPRVPGSERSWLASVTLNRARSRHRRSLRRAEREAAAARPEAAEPASAALERLELQQRVVAAVLGLPAHYRRAILLVFYEGLSAAEAARRLDVPPGTVRAQLSRGLAELRQRLDATEPGGRAAWTVALASLVRPRPVPVLAGGIAVGGLLMGVGAWVVSRLPAPENAPAIAAAPAVAGEPAPAGLAAASAASVATPAPDRGPIVAPPPADPDLARLPTPELYDFALWAQHVLRQRLLTAEPNDVGPELAGLHDADGFGATRIVRADRFEFADNTPLGLRGGGAYFAFLPRSHQYDDIPDLQLGRSGFLSAFAGNDRGFLLDLGDVPLARVDSVPPVRFDARERDAYAHLWGPATTRQGELEGGFVERAGALGLQAGAPARVGSTYLLRSLRERQHDVLVAFRTVAADDFGYTLVWRVLRTFGVFAEQVSSMPKPPAGRAPGWLLGKSVDELLDLLARLRALGETRLLTVPPAVLAAQRAFLAGPGTGACRILERGHLAALIRVRGGGAYYDFDGRSHDYNATPQLTLEQGSFHSGFAGTDRGLVLDLGAASIESAEVAERHADRRLREAVAFLRDLQAERGQDGRWQMRAEDYDRGCQLGCREAAAVTGHTYLLRAVTERCDLTVAFRVVERDADSATLVWRLVPAK